MLLPFLFFQLPLGHLADKKYGEKEILIIGFVVMGATTMLIPYIGTASLIFWAAIYLEPELVQVLLKSLPKFISLNELVLKIQI